MFQGVLVAALTLIGAAAYAFSTPETFRSEAMVVLEISGDPSKLALPTPQDIAHRMRETLLVDSELELLGRDSSRAPTGNAAKELARRSIEVRSAGGRTYGIAYSGPEPESVQRACNTLAERVSDRAPVALGAGVTTQGPDPLEASMRKLASFAASHPEVALGTDTHADDDTERAQKATLEALRNRRTTILARLDEIKTHPPVAAENPYDEPVEDADALNRQLAAVNAAIARGEAAQKPAKAATDPEVVKEWKQLVVAVADARRQAGDQPHGPPVSLAVRIVSAASLPTAPTSSKRTAILALGSVVAALAGALWTAVAVTASRRRTGRQDSTPPRTSSEPPAADPLQSAFSVPVTSARSRPPANPVPQPARSGGTPSAHPEPMRAREPVSSRASPEPERPRGDEPEAKRPSDRPLARASSRPHSSYSYVSARPPPPDDDGPTEAVERVEQGPKSPPPVVHSPAPAVHESAPPSPRRDPHADAEVSFVDVGWTPPESLYPIDALKSVRDQVFALGLEKCAVVLVSGPAHERARKARLAARLALALADTGHPRVLLLEGDLDNPAVSRTMAVDMPMSAGLSQQLEGFVRSDSPRPLTVLRCSPSLHVLGESVIRSPGIVLSVVFELALSTFRRYFDVIVIDGPPAAESMDLRAIDALVDGVVFADPSLKGGSLGLGAAPGPAVRHLFGDKRLLVAVPA